MDEKEKQFISSLGLEPFPFVVYCFIETDSAILESCFIFKNQLWEENCSMEETSLYGCSSFSLWDVKYFGGMSLGSKLANVSEMVSIDMGERIGILSY